MTKRFETLGLKHRFIDAIPRYSKFIDAMAHDADNPVPITDDLNMHCIDHKAERSSLTHHSRGIYSCLYSHLLAIRTYLMYDSESPYGIICEDDVHLHKDFVAKLESLQEILEKFKPDTLSLGYLTLNIPNIRAALGPDSPEALLLRYHESGLWGTQMYLISRDFAGKMLEYFDRPIKYYGQYFPTADFIITRSKRGYFIHPPMAVEEMGDSVNSSSAPDDFHVRVHKEFYTPDHI